MAAHQAPPSLGLSRQEHWSGLPFPSPTHESEKWKGSRSAVSDCSRAHGLQPTRLLHPWDFPGKSTGVGCHRFLCLSVVFWMYILLVFFKVSWICGFQIFNKVGKFSANSFSNIFSHPPSLFETEKITACYVLMEIIQEGWRNWYRKEKQKCWGGIW